MIYDACPHPGRPYQVDLTLAPGGVPVPARLAFLEEGIIRYTLDPTGAFAPYARPNSPAHAARIPAQPDESARYAHPPAHPRGARGRACDPGGLDRGAA